MELLSKNNVDKGLKREMINLRCLKLIEKLVMNTEYLKRVSTTYSKRFYIRNQITGRF